MNNISDKLVMTIILITILFVFGLIFSVKSPERKVLDSPIMWKDDYSNISLFRSNKIKFRNKKINLNKNSLLTRMARSYSNIYKYYFDSQSICHFIFNLSSSKELTQVSNRH